MTENDKCGNILRLGDDFGDNECSFACMLEAGHDGPHRDEFEHEGRSVVIIWHADDDSGRIADGEHLPFVGQS